MSGDLQDKKEDTQEETPKSQNTKANTDAKDNPENFLPEGVKVAFIITVDERNNGKVGVQGAEHLIKYPITSYGYLKMAEKELDLMYAKMGVYSRELEQNMQTAKTQHGFRSFVKNFGKRGR